MGVVNDLKNKVGDVVKREDATIHTVVKIQNSTDKLVDNVYAVEKKVYIYNHCTTLFYFIRNLSTHIALKFS